MDGQVIDRTTWPRKFTSDIWKEWRELLSCEKWQGTRLWELEILSSQEGKGAHLQLKKQQSTHCPMCNQGGKIPDAFSGGQEKSSYGTSCKGRYVLRRDGPFSEACQEETLLNLKKQGTSETFKQVMDQVWLRDISPVAVSNPTPTATSAPSLQRGPRTFPMAASVHKLAILSRVTLAPHSIAYHIQQRSNLQDLLKPSIWLTVKSLFVFCFTWNDILTYCETG